MASESTRKQQIMEHLARSTGKYTLPASGSDRKQRILDHVRRTTG